MAVDCDQAGSPSTDGTDAMCFNPDQTTATAVYSLLDAVDSQSVGDGFEIGTHSKTYDFDNLVKIAVHEGIDPSGSLAEVEETIDTAAEMEKMAASTLSRYTKDQTNGGIWIFPSRSITPTASACIPEQQSEKA